jgi:hypothetical protein
MKKGIFFIILSMSSIGLSAQKYDLTSHPLISEVWKSVYKDSVSEFRPIGFKSFSFEHKYISDNIDQVKIQSYLYESFNKFRTDYGLKTVLEDANLSGSSTEYSKQILNDFKHDINAGILFSEAIAEIPFNMLSRISKKDGDFNKIIADCCFDIFVGSPAHMAILLNENPKRKFGFGISVSNKIIGVVVRSTSK